MAIANASPNDNELPSQLLNININPIMLMITICPACIFAYKRINKEKGLINTPNTSIGIKTIYKKILNYTAFTDIEFNPKKSINCQARSCALYVSLVKNELLDIALESEEAFLEIISKDSFYKIEKVQSQEL